MTKRIGFLSRFSRGEQFALSLTGLVVWLLGVGIVLGNSALAEFGRPLDMALLGSVHPVVGVLLAMTGALGATLIGSELVLEINRVASPLRRSVYAYYHILTVVVLTLSFIGSVSSVLAASDGLVNPTMVLVAMLAFLLLFSPVWLGMVYLQHCGLRRIDEDDERVDLKWGATAGGGRFR